MFPEFDRDFTLRIGRSFAIYHAQVADKWFLQCHVPEGEGYFERAEIDQDKVDTIVSDLLIFIRQFQYDRYDIGVNQTTVSIWKHADTFETSIANGHSAESLLRGPLTDLQKALLSYKDFKRRLDRG